MTKKQGWKRRRKQQCFEVRKTVVAVEVLRILPLRRLPLLLGRRVVMVEQPFSFLCWIARVVARTRILVRLVVELDFLEWLLEQLRSLLGLVVGPRDLLLSRCCLGWNCRSRRHLPGQ